MKREYLDCTTQAELDAACARQHADPDVIPRCIGAGQFEVWGSSHVEAWGSSHVVAWGSSHVEAWGSSHVVARGSSHVVARGSSHVKAWDSSHVVALGSSHVKAWDSSHVVALGSSHVKARGSSHVEALGSSHVVALDSSHVEALGSSHVVALDSSHVVAWGSSHVEARGSSHVEASRFVAVHQQSDGTTVTGGVLIRVEGPVTAEAWCEFHGVTVNDGVALLFKAVRDDYRSAHGILYAPGTMPEAPDWDGGEAECGGGLHFVPHPVMGLEFDGDATRFVACPVALRDMRAPQKTDHYPHKIKARRLAGAVYEVDRRGERVSEPT